MQGIQSVQLTNEGHAWKKDSFSSGVEKKKKKGIYCR